MFRRTCHHNRKATSVSSVMFFGHYGGRFLPNLHLLLLILKPVLEPKMTQIFICVKKKKLQRSHFMIPDRAQSTWTEVKVSWFEIVIILHPPVGRCAAAAHHEIC